MGADSGTFSTLKIIENRMISIVFLRKWEVMGAPARPPKIIENVMSNHFPFQEFYYRNLQYLVIPRFKNVSHYSYFSGTFADSCRVVQLYSDHGKSTRHKVLAQVPGTRFSPPPRHNVRPAPPAQGWHKVLGGRVREQRPPASNHIAT